MGRLLLVLAALAGTAAAQDEPPVLHLRGQPLDTRVTLRTNDVTLGDATVHLQELIESLGVAVQLRDPPPQDRVAECRAELYNRTVGTVVAFAGARLSAVPQPPLEPRLAAGPLPAFSGRALHVHAWPTLPALGCVLLLTALLVVRRRQRLAPAVRAPVPDA
jgi:hypothetical protein